MDYVGGLVGYSEPGRCHGSATAALRSMAASVGGLVGCNGDGGVQRCTTQCYSTGAVSGSGLSVGWWVERGTVTQCYSTGAVSGIGAVGGLVADNGGM